MNYSSIKIKRRAAAAATFALLVFGGSLILGIAAQRIQDRALHPRVDLGPLLSPLGATADSAERQRLLDRFLAERPELLAAVVLDSEDRVQALIPGREQWMGRSLRPEPEETPEESRPLLELWPGRAPGYLPRVVAPRLGAPPFRDEQPVFQRRQVAGRVRSLLADVQREGQPTEMRSVSLHTPGAPAGRLYVLPRRDDATHDLGTTLERASSVGTFFSLLVYWCMLPLWVLLDARARTDKAVPLAIFVFLTNFLGWLTYLVIRPEASRVCPACITLMEPGFRLCPVCGWNAPKRCYQCHRAVRSHWRFCPYCEAPMPERTGDPLANDPVPAAPETV